MRTVQIWMYPGCVASAVTGTLDILTGANSIWAMRHPDADAPLFSWALLSLEGLPVPTSCGVTLQSDGPIDAKRAADVVILPGLYVANGTTGLLRDVAALKSLVPLLQQTHAHGNLLAANCSAVFMLAEAGLLDGGHATTAWWLERPFRARYPHIELRLSEVLTEYQRVICSGAATAHLNLTLHLVERFAGPEICSQCARMLLIDANRQSQSAYVTLTEQDSQSHGDALVARAQKWMYAHQRQNFSLRDLAHYLAVSERTVIRRFHKAIGKTPTAYAQQLRIDVTKRLLETSTLSLNEVSESVGYQDISAFHRLFKRETGLSPTQYRHTFRQFDRLLAST